MKQFHCLVKYKNGSEIKMFLCENSILRIVEQLDVHSVDVIPTVNSTY